MKFIIKIVIIFLIEFYSSQLLYAQVLSKIRISKKNHPNARRTLNRDSKNSQDIFFQDVWSDCSACNAIFFTKGHRVKFFDHIGDTDNKKEYRTYWKISNNKLSFYYSGGTVITDAIIKLNKDSLVLYRKDTGTFRYVRLK